MATHLKDRFPNLKIGGSAYAGRSECLDRFLKYRTEDGKMPLDFFLLYIRTKRAKNMQMCFCKPLALLGFYANYANYALFRERK